MKTRTALLLLIVGALVLPTAIVAQEEAPNQVLFENVRVFDGTTDGLTPPTSVLVENNLIKAIGSRASVGPQVVRIDGGGRTLMPGLIDSHAHFNMNGANLADTEGMKWDEIGARAVAQAQDWLADGFTTVRGMGGSADGLKRTIDAGLLDGPRIYPSGSYVSQTAGHGDLVLRSQQTDPQSSNGIRLGLTQMADGADAVRRAVRRNFAEGASQIKLMVGGGISSEKGPLFAGQFTDAEIRAAVEEAAARDSYVAVHVYQDAHIRRAPDRPQQPLPR